jgi:hypothetical protein
MSVKTKMTAIADKLRALLNITDKMGLDAMANNIGKAQNEVDKQAELIEQIRSALAGKVAGGTGIIPTGTKYITENGVYDVTSYANVDVSTSDFVPTGTKYITENGVYDVTAYANVDVSTSGFPEGITALRTFSTDLSSVNGSMGARLSHRLGKTPDFYYLFSYLPQGAFIDGSPNTVLNICATKNLFDGAATIAEVTEAVTYVNDTGEVTTVLDSGRISGYFDAEYITVYNPTNAEFRTDGLYYVVVGCYDEVA